MLDINVETAGRSAFANEYPFRQLPDSSITSAPTLKYTNEDDATLATTLYTKTNEIVPSAVKPRPEYCGKDVSVASPVDLFKSKIRLTAKHGAFAEQLLAKTDSTYIDLTAHQFWQLVCDWFTLMGKRLANALRRSKQGKPPRHMHPSADEALLFVMCESEFLKDEYIGLTFDLRSYWEALERGLPPPELKPIQKDDERRESLNSDGLSQLYQFSPVADADVFDMMSNSKFDSGFSVPAGQRMLVLDPNAATFDKHIEISIEKVEDEMAKGMLQGFYLGPPFLPIMVLRNSYIIQKGKPRRICQADAPYNFTWEGIDVSLNAGISIDGNLALPTVMQFANNSLIAETLFTATQDPQFHQEQIYTDYTAFYRYLVPMLFYVWTTCCFLHPAGCTADLGTGFGQMSAPFLACSVMNILLYYWSLLFLLLLDECTTWDVTTASECHLGESNMVCKAGYLDHVGGQWTPVLRSLASSLIKNLPRTCVGWDSTPAARRWRQTRYDKAINLGE